MSAAIPGGSLSHFHPPGIAALILGLDGFLMKKYATMLLLISASMARADDATQFRGDLGVSKEKGLPTKWGAADNIRWTAELPGKGLSNPVIADGRVYVSATSAYQQKREVVLCFDLKTARNSGNASSPRPATPPAIR